MDKICIVIGARPNFMKAYPLCCEFDKRGIEYNIFHSGQHYDKEMNDTFMDFFKFKNLKNIHIQPGNKIRDLQHIMYCFKEYLIETNPKTVILLGDVDTTYVCSLVAKSLNKVVVHVEAGLRSFDSDMPEEKNRITVDHLSDILFSPTHESEHNLYDENVSGKVFMVGNIMIDCLIKSLPLIKQEVKNSNVIVTFHRPENVDTNNIFILVDELRRLSYNFQVIFPMHPRTRKRMEELNLISRLSKVDIVKPMGYIDFINLVYNAYAVITDSGGIQEETTYLNIPCFTVRKSTERPITITEGTNHIIALGDIVNNVINAKRGEHKIPKFWDGKTAERIVDILQKEAL